MELMGDYVEFYMICCNWNLCNVIYPKFSLSTGTPYWLRKKMHHFKTADGAKYFILVTSNSLVDTPGMLVKVRVFSECELNPVNVCFGKCFCLQNDCT